MTDDVLTTAAALEGLRAVVRRLFPDARSKPISDELLLQIARALPEEAQESLFGEVLGKLLGEEIPAIEGEHILGYYAARATHEHFGVCRFTEALPLVRVRVPEQREDIATAIGIVFAGDHPRYTLSLVQSGYAQACEALAQKASAARDEDTAAVMRACAGRAGRIVRVERYTPARYLGARFGAVAIDVLFGPNGPMAWRATGGMATGESVVDYTAPTLDEIERVCGYHPTPISDESNTYAARIELNHAGTLERFTIAPRTAASRSPYANIRVQLEAAEPAAVHPSLLTARAAMRMAAICEWTGRPFDGVPELVAKVLAAAGRDLPWGKKPDA